MVVNPRDEPGFIPAAERILKHLSALIGANTFFIASTDFTTNSILKAINRADILVQEGSLPFNETYCSLVVDNVNEATVFPDTLLHPEASLLKATERIGGAAFIGFPIVLRSGQIFGTLCAMDRDYRFTDEDGELIASIAQFIGFMVDLERDMFFDVLTGLPTLEYVKHYFSRMPLAPGDHAAFIVIDIDRFRSVNVSRDTGDRLLQILAKRLSDNAGEDGFAVRMGGDEFLVVRRARLDDRELAEAAGKLMAALSEPIGTERQEFNLTACLGISVYPRDGENIDELLQRAMNVKDIVKKEGPNHFAVFTKEALFERERLLWIENHLLPDLRDGRFDVYYQPQFDIGTGRVKGFEALVRWRSEPYGYIPPSEFIPVAESTGHIVALGSWVFRQVCGQIAEWNHKWGRNYTVSVNVSPVEFQQLESALDMLAQVAGSFGIGLDQLRMEITETTMILLHERVKPVLNELRKKGVRIALDDFGTGYSSILYLRDFPIDIIKIDRVFVKDILSHPKDRKIIKALIHLADALGLEVVAEGIENEDILELMRELGCHTAQGYLLGKPAPAAEAGLYLER